MDEFKRKLNSLHLSCCLLMVQPGKKVNMAKRVDVVCTAPSLINSLTNRTHWHIRLSKYDKRSVKKKTFNLHENYLEIILLIWNSFYTFTNIFELLNCINGRLFYSIVISTNFVAQNIENVKNKNFVCLIVTSVDRTQMNDNVSEGERERVSERDKSGEWKRGKWFARERECKSPFGIEWTWIVFMNDCTWIICSLVSAVVGRRIDVIE